jgi:hypothetical protein
MNRRTLIALLGSAAVSRFAPARAQRSSKPRNEPGEPDGVAG